MLKLYRQRRGILGKNNETPQQSFRFLLLSLVLMIILPAIFPAQDQKLFWTIILSITLLSSLYLVANKAIELVIGIILAICVLTPGYINLFHLNVGSQITSIITSIIFFSYISIFIARYLYRATQISEDLIHASICLYIIGGMIWGFVYYLTELIFPGSFNITTDLNHQANLQDLLYFSFVTMTTLGYGDIVPVSQLARSWVTVEALFGQIYLTVVIAYLVGLHLAVRIEHRRPPANKTRSPHNQN